MVSNKTGGLFRLTYKLMKTETQATVDLLPIVELLGVLFQVADDYKNLRSEEYGNLKGFGEDLTEGKFSFPVIHSIRSNPEDAQLLHILQQRSSDVHIKLCAIQIMEKTGSLDYTKRTIRRLVAQIHELVCSLDQGQREEKSIRKLLNKIAEL